MYVCYGRLQNEFHIEWLGSFGKPHPLHIPRHWVIVLWWSDPQSPPLAFWNPYLKASVNSWGRLELPMSHNKLLEFCKNLKNFRLNGILPKEELLSPSLMFNISILQTWWIYLIKFFWIFFWTIWLVVKFSYSTVIAAWQEVEQGQLKARAPEVSWGKTVLIKLREKF